MLNNCVIIGRLTKDPELSYVGAKSTAMCKFSVAVDRKFTKQGGERETDYFDVVCFGKTAESTNQHLGKGRLVAVSGSVEIHKWKTQDGQWRSAVQFNAETVRFLDHAKDGPAEERQQTADKSGDRPPVQHPATGQKDFGDASTVGQEVDDEIDLDDDPF